MFSTTGSGSYSTFTRSAASAREWEGFRTRIAAHAPRWRLLGVNYYPSPQIDWQ